MSGLKSEARRAFIFISGDIREERGGRRNFLVPLILVTKTDILVYNALQMKSKGCCCFPLYARQNFLDDFCLR